MVTIDQQKKVVQFYQEKVIERQIIPSRFRIPIWSNTLNSIAFETIKLKLANIVLIEVNFFCQINSKF